MNGESKSIVCNMLVAFLCVITLNGCSKDIHDHSKLTTGKQLFDYCCSGCHKETGKGKFLKGIPASKGTSLSAFQLIHKIKNDEESGSKMPAFPTLSNEQAQKIAEYIKSM